MWELVFSCLQNHYKMKRVQINRWGPVAVQHKHSAVFCKLSVGKQLHGLVTVQVFVRRNLQTAEHGDSDFMISPEAPILNPLAGSGRNYSEKHQ